MKKINKKSTKRFLLSFGGFLLLGTGIGIGIGSGKTINQNQISFLNTKINNLSFQLREYSEENKQDKSKVQNLKIQREQLQLFAQGLSNLTSSNANLDKLSSNISNPKASNDGYKAFEQPLLNWKESLSKKVLSLTKTLKKLSDNSNNFTEDSQKAIASSLKKVKNLSNSLKSITFNNTSSAVKAFNSIQKAQNTFLTQLTNVINLVSNQIRKHKQEVDDLNDQITQRDEKIKELAEKLISQLGFYLKWMSEFKGTLKDFDDSKFEQTDKVQVEKIKTKVNSTLKLLTTKEAYFNQLFEQMNQSLTDAQDDNDYSNIQSYDLNDVNKSFERIIKEYDSVKDLINTLYEKEIKQKISHISAQSQQINNLEQQNNELQNQVDSLNNQKTTLEENLEQTKNDLMSNLALVLENQITTLDTIEQTIRSSSDANADVSADKLKNQIEILTNLKTQYTADNYSQTFITVVNNALKVAQEVIQEYKSNVLDTLKVQYQNTLESLNSTKEELVATQSELNAKNQELTNTQNALNSVRAELEKNKIILTKTQETLRTTQSQLEALNTQIIISKVEAKTVYDNVKELYDNIKTKAQDFLGSVNQNLDFSHLRSQLAKIAPTFDERANLEQNQANIKSLIELSTNLNSAYQSALQQDYDINTAILNNSISSLNSSIAELQKNVNNLSQRQNIYSTLLVSNVNSLTREYKNRKSLAIKIKLAAEQWQINVSEIKKLLALSDLQTPENNAEKQIDFINEYTNRIINLYTETIQLQKKIVAKTENTLNSKNNLSKKLQNQLDLANDEIRGKAFTIKNLNNENQNYKKNLIEKNSLINSLQNQIQTVTNQLKSSQVEKTSIETQLSKVRSDLSTMTTNYTKFKNLILNSKLYKNATKHVLFYQPYGFGTELYGTGYTNTNTDKQKYGEYFYNFTGNPKKPQQVSVLNRINILSRGNYQYKFKIYYIDANETDDANKLKVKKVQIPLDAFNNDRKYSFKLNLSEKETNAGKTTSLQFVVVRRIEFGKFEFTNVVANLFTKDYGRGLDYYNLVITSPTVMVAVDDDE
ncbi:hypothetical protein NPA08_03170 [Mycoplasmopsis citelli]|uniref:hypothetical protein n=1 Tax=Mycoplasmopsis citelli TaxID=171281 RepID=UPI0021154708|nr:hypothetical protein [Mycoplasmopsis citelli]UUD35934.1 hypothetical protein NPA08_03170 [Mycoplasmopsis citelli]